MRVGTDALRLGRRGADHKGMETLPVAAEGNDVAAWAAHGRLGAAVTTTGVASSSLYALMKYGGTLPAGLALLLAIAPVVTGFAFARVPWARLLAGGRGLRLFTAASVATITSIGILGVLDGGVKSPLLLWLFPALAYAAVGYRPREVLAIGLYAMATVGAVALVSDDRLWAGSELAAVVLVVHVVNARLVSGNSRAQRRLLERASGRLRHLADHDPLTGCGNRRALEARAAALSVAEPDGPHCLLLLDVDHFKAVNDRLGHAAGDRALQRVAGALRSTVRQSDLVARFGGEEFAVMLPGLDVQAAGRLAERLRVAVASAGTDPQLTASFGLAPLTSGPAGLDVALRDADIALYQAKNAGRNQVWGPLGPVVGREAPHPPARPTRHGGSALVERAGLDREELVAGRPLHFWIAQARIAAFLPGLTGVFCLAYAVLRDRGHGGALIAVVAVSTATVTTMGLLPWERIIRRTGLAVFFAWSVVDLVTILAIAALDGGAGSPLALLVYPTALFIGTSYGRRHVVAFITGVWLALAAAVLTRGGVARALVEALALGALTATTIRFAERQRDGVAREQAMADRLRELVNTDAVTGLLSRPAFLERAATLHGAGPSVVCIVDLDHFKQLNDEYGHSMGDQVLTSVGAALRLAVDETRGVVGRLGGEEFGVVLPSNPATRPNALQAGERLRHAVANSDAAVPVRASVGVTSTIATTSLDAALARADEALYRAKQAGRDRVCEHGPGVLRTPIETSGPTEARSWQ
jgi:diguanylate cyclase (GGDEF)-like protein